MQDTVRESNNKSRRKMASNVCAVETKVLASDWVNRMQKEGPVRESRWVPLKNPFPVQVPELLSKSDVRGCGKSKEHHFRQSPQPKCRSHSSPH